MALTLEKYQRLEGAKLTDLYEDHKALWRAKGNDAYSYTNGFIAPSPVRPDDLLQPLQAALVVSKELKNHLAAKKLSEKYWPLWFAELIVEKCWAELTGGEQAK